MRKDKIKKQRRTLRERMEDESGKKNSNIKNNKKVEKENCR